MDGDPLAPGHIPEPDELVPEANLAPKLPPPERLPLRVTNPPESSLPDFDNAINDIDVSTLINMDSSITRVMLPGFSVNHQYDFGATSTTTLTCRSIYALRAIPSIMVATRNNPSDTEEHNSPMEGLPCFDSYSRKKPPTVPGQYTREILPAWW